MKIIKELSEYIEEEIGDACKYAKAALKVKESDKALADVFYALSIEEVKHMNMLHDEVVKLIGNYRKEHGDPPAAMLAVYEYLHEKHIEDMQKVKNYQVMYNER